MSERKPRRAVGAAAFELSSDGSNRRGPLKSVMIERMLLLRDPEYWIRPGFVLKPDTDGVDGKAYGGEEGCSSLG